MMDWFLVTCGGAAVYAAGRWLQSRLQGRRDRAYLSGNQRRGIPLKAVVANCEAKWFLQELQQAMSGDHTAMVRVSHMLLVGYGTRQDEAAAASWMRKAWALQNFKEPADAYLQYDMLDLRNSDIPVLNDDLEPAAAAAGSETQSAAAMAAAAGEAVSVAAGLRRRTRQSSNSSRRHSGTQEAPPNALPAHEQAAAEAGGGGVPDALVGIRTQPVLDAGCSSSGSSGADSTGVQAGAAGGQGSRSGSSNRTTGSAARQHAAVVQDEALASQAMPWQQLHQQQQQQPPLLPLVKAAEQAMLQTVLQLPQATVAMPAAVMVVQQQVAAMAAAGRPPAGQDQQQGSLAEQWPQLPAQLLTSCAP